MFVVGVLLLLVMFVPCWLGIRLGATFATVLGICTIVPLVLLCVLPFFKPGSLDGFDNLSLSLSSSPIGTKGSWQLILGWSFIYTWTVLAMEAAACYIGECREPVRDAKIAITAEGLFGFFIYLTLPIMVFSVLGTAGSTSSRRTTRAGSAMPTSCSRATSTRSSASTSSGRG